MSIPIGDNMKVLVSPLGHSYVELAPGLIAPLGNFRSRENIERLLGQELVEMSAADYLLTQPARLG